MLRKNDAELQKVLLRALQILLVLLQNLFLYWDTMLILMANSTMNEQESVLKHGVSP